MKKLFTYTLFLAFLTIILPNLSSANDTYYARCNLKVIKGTYITWVNWQSTLDMIPLGSKLRVSHIGKKTKLIVADTDKKYILFAGRSAKKYITKVFSKEPVSIEDFSPDFRDEINGGYAVEGMSKKEVYAAMGPPASADKANAYTMTYKRIMNTNLWGYRSRRFHKNIGVHFDRKTGKVDRTQGIWQR